MNISQTCVPKKGYFLLSLDCSFGYKGIDRKPFEPIIFEEDVEREQYLPTQGWRREAYKIFNANLVDVGDEDMYILSNIPAAAKIQTLIEPYLGSHEIIFCEIWDIDMAYKLTQHTRSDFMGYDIAYPGGDYYSAIKNGLFHNQVDVSLLGFRSFLNRFGLFAIPNIIPTFITTFKKIHLSEQKSTFSVFCLFYCDLIRNL